MATTSKKIATDINKLVSKGLKDYQGVQKKKKQPISKGRNQSASLVSSAQNTGTAAIVGPLTEVDNSRTYHPTRTLNSPDAIFLMNYSPIATMSFQDGNGQIITVNLDDPDA